MGLDPYITLGYKLKCRCVFIFFSTETTMSTIKYAGKLYYSYPGNDHLDVSAFIIRGNEIAFALASVTQEHGRWEANSGHTATVLNDGTFLAKGIPASKLGVPSAFPWDIKFKLEKLDGGKSLDVSGELTEGGISYNFSGELESA
jgi:hypothetical protein